MYYTFQQYFLENIILTPPIMKNLSTEKKWLLGNIKAHIYPPTSPIVKCEPERKKTERHCIKVKLWRNDASSTSETYEYKMALFENIYPKYFLLFIRDFWNKPKVSREIPYTGIIKYLHNFLRGKALCEFETLSE